jgi:hypothetical protein
MEQSLSNLKGKMEASFELIARSTIYKTHYLMDNLCRIGNLLMVRLDGPKPADLEIKPIKSEIFPQIKMHSIKYGIKPQRLIFRCTPRLFRKILQGRDAELS